MRIDAEMLIARGACEGQVAIFKGEWPKGVFVTLETCTRALKLNLDLTWFACKFLSATAWEAYGRTVEAARADYEQAEITARTEYKQAMDADYDAAWAAYWQAEITAYRQATTAAWAAYEQVKAQALWTAICKTEEDQRKTVDTGRRTWWREQRRTRR
jgi:hypothetical protein